MRTHRTALRFIISLMAGLLFAAAVWAAGKPFDQAGFDAAQAAGKPMLVMALFGLGAGLPLVVLGSFSREAMLRLRGKLLAAGEQGKKVLGAVMLLLAVFILTGLDKRFETWVLDVAPAWLTQIGTSL